MQELPAAPGLLVVDDERCILDVVGIVARRAGLVVWTAHSGVDALSLFSQHRAAISLVLCDVRMPGLDGPTTVAQLRQMEPGLRVCFMSGHLGRQGAEQLHALGALRIFEKPFDLSRLGEELFELASADRATAA